MDCFIFKSLDLSGNDLRDEVDLVSLLDMNEVAELNISGNMKLKNIQIF